MLLIDNGLCCSLEFLFSNLHRLLADPHPIILGPDPLLTGDNLMSPRFAPSVHLFCILGGGFLREGRQARGCGAGRTGGICASDCLSLVIVRRLDGRNAGQFSPPLSVNIFFCLIEKSEYCRKQLFNQHSIVLKKIQPQITTIRGGNHLMKSCQEA